MSSAAKVGIFMLVILGILGYFVLKIERVSIGGGPTKKVTAIFDSVAGLDKKSKVRVAGVPVGEVTDIRLRPDGKAQVTMDVDRNVELHNGAFARVVNLGLLGEKYIELVPGPVNAPVLPEQQALRGTQPASIDDVTNQISAIATDVKAITTSLRTAVAGPQGEQRLQQIVENARQITEQVRDLIQSVFHEFVSESIQHLVHEIGHRLLARFPQMAEVAFEAQNRTRDPMGESVGDAKLKVYSDPFPAYGVILLTLTRS